MFCSIVLINRNGGIELGDVLLSLRAALDFSCTHRCDFELLFVDNGSSDNSVETFHSAMEGARFEFRVVHESIPGVNSSRNAGLKAARGKYLIFTDNDLRFSEQWLDAYLKAFEDNPNIKVFAGRVLVGDVEGEQPSWLALSGPYIRTSIVVRCDNGDQSFTAELGRACFDGPVGPNMAFERSIFQEHGPFDTRFGLRPGSLVPGAEAEYFHRLGKNPMEFVYVAEACVWHPLRKNQVSKSYFLARLEGIGRVQSRIQRIDGFRVPTLFGVKRYLFKQLAVAWVRWIVSIPFADSQKRFFLRTDIAHIFGQIKEDLSSRSGD